MKQMKDIINQIDPFAFIKPFQKPMKFSAKVLLLDKEKQPINQLKKSDWIVIQPDFFKLLLRLFE